jgi:hypothetical protein
MRLETGGWRACARASWPSRPRPLISTVGFGFLSPIAARGTGAGSGNATVRYIAPLRGGPGRPDSFRALSTSPGNLLRIRAVQVPQTRTRPSHCVSSATVARANCLRPFRQPMRLHTSHHGPACGTRCSPNPGPRCSRRTGTAGSARIISTGFGFASCGAEGRDDGIGTPLSSPLPGPAPGRRLAIRARSRVIRTTASAAACTLARSRRAASFIASASASSPNPACRSGRLAVLVLTGADRLDPNRPAASRAEGARPAPRLVPVWKPSRSAGGCRGLPGCD